MTAEKLIEVLKSVPRDTKILRAVGGSIYHEVGVQIGTALHITDPSPSEISWTEDWGEEETPEGEQYGKRHTVIIIN